MNARQIKSGMRAGTTEVFVKMSMERHFFLHCWCLSYTQFYKIEKTSKVVNEEFFDKMDQAVHAESLRTQEGHCQTVKRIK
jgi:hypothetical protein